MLITQRKSEAGKDSRWCYRYGIGDGVFGTVLDGR